MRRDVRVLLVGDGASFAASRASNGSRTQLTSAFKTSSYCFLSEGVGKSTLITSVRSSSSFWLQYAMLKALLCSFRSSSSVPSSQT